MIPEAFKYNEDVNYLHGGVFKKKNINIIKQEIIISSDGNGTAALHKSFNVDFPNIFEKYLLPKVTSEEIVKRWESDWMLFWQNQLNFAIWCSTTGCGVDIKNHINAGSVSQLDKGTAMDGVQLQSIAKHKVRGLTGSLFLFHIYYQTRRILKELSISLPQNKSWNAFNNNYDREAYEKICSEFNVDPNTDWRHKEGLGIVYTTSHTAWERTDFRRDNSSQHLKSSTSQTLDLSKMTFGPEVPGGRHCGISKCEYLPPKKVHIDYIKQPDEFKNIWTTFILDESKGFTQAGVERINESIRIYCWAILGAQSQTKTDILGTGMAFDAQKQFLANVQDAVDSPIDIPTQIKKYESVLKYARSKVDYVYGIGLYMSPSDMELRIGTIQDYNNEIVVAEEEEIQTLGINNDVNVSHVEPTTTQPTDISGTPTKKSLPEISKPIVSQPDYGTAAEHSVRRKPSDLIETTDEHEDDKTAIITGSITVGLLALFIYEYVL